MKKLCLFGLAFVLTCLQAWPAKYKVKPIQPKPAAEYPAHQAFQNMVIAARAYATEEETLEIFDSKKLYEKEILPVLIVLENNNDFPVQLRGADIYLVLENGTNVPPLPLVEVLLRIKLKKPLTSYSTRKEILVRQLVEPEMFLDFEHKSLEERLIAPHDSDYGVVFFPYPEDDLEKCRIYLPEIENLAESEKLMFFEFPLSARGDQ